MGDCIEEVGEQDNGKPMGDDQMNKGSSSKERNEEKKDDHKVDAMEALKSQYLESIEKHKERIQTLETSILQLANYYFVFQGVIFTAVFNGSSHIKCHFRYLAFFLSLIAAGLNLAALFVISLRHQRFLRELDVKIDLWNKMTYVDKQEKESGWERKLRVALLILTMSMLALFAGLNLYGTWMILCYKNQQCICSSKECIKLCN